jgi:oligopeptide/dipeptide ABC transporter ATP-binding protein
MINILTIKNLHVHYRTIEGVTRAVNGVNLQIPTGKTVAVVGESGCGKSALALAIMRLVEPAGEITSGTITFQNDNKPINISDFPPESPELNKLRGKNISMIFQEPMSSLSPLHTVGSQIAEAGSIHGMMNIKAKARAIEMMTLVGIGNAEKRFKQYPHEMSGGLRQRVMIAMAMMNDPNLLIADEPTTALDVTIQAGIIKLLKDVQKKLGMAVLLITHDLGVAAQMADYIAVMYLGRVVEFAPAEKLLSAPQHPYTIGLLKSMPGITPAGSILPTIRGTLPEHDAVIPGCPFFNRCDEAIPGNCDIGGIPAAVITSDGWVECLLRKKDAKDD